MRFYRRVILARILAAAALGSLGAPLPAASADLKRGEYLVAAGGCVGCHTADQKNAIPFAGGRALKTPFGTFYGPNITPHPAMGIGRWTEADFINAMRHGTRPDGASYYPAFPYPSFTKIVDADLRDMWAYLRALPPSDRPSKRHDLRFPFGWRNAVSFWKWLFFSPGAFKDIPGAGPVVNRGAYLVQALSHCGECHTPRNFLGAPRSDRFLAGGRDFEDRSVPSLTPKGLELWSDDNLREFFRTGSTPDGDTVAEAMDEVIRNTTSKLTTGDLNALIAYLRSLAPQPAERR